MPDRPLSRRGLLLAGLPFGLTEGDRLRFVVQQNGWTVLRDRLAPPAARETGIILLRALRPVPPDSRPGQLTAALRAFRPFRFGVLPGEEKVVVGGIPGVVIEASAQGAPSGEDLVVRAMRLDAPARSLLVIGAAPSGDWPALRTEIVAVMESVRP